MQGVQTYQDFKKIDQEKHRDMVADLKQSEPRPF